MADGRDGEFSEYVGRCWLRLVRTALLLGCAPAQAEDVVQSALLRCYVNWGRVRRADYPDAYVYRVLLNTISDARRRRWSGERPVANPVAVADAVDPSDDWALTQDIERALSRLSSDQRTVVVLRYFLNLSEDQMAGVLDVAAGTVKSRLSRAVKALAADPSITELGEQA